MTRQRESLNVLLENMDKYHELIEVSRTATGTAEEKYLSYTEQLEASQKRISAAWEEIASNANINNFLTQVNNVIAKLMEALPFILKWGSRFVSVLVGAKMPQFVEKLGKFLLILDKTGAARGPKELFNAIKEALTGVKSVASNINIKGASSQFVGGSNIITFGKSAPLVVSNQNIGKEAAFKNNLMYVKTLEQMGEGKIVQNSPFVPYSLSVPKSIPSDYQKEYLEGRYAPLSTDWKITGAQFASDRNWQSANDYISQITKQKQENLIDYKHIPNIKSKTRFKDLFKRNKMSGGAIAGAAALSAITAAMTAPTTHEYGGQTVESSKEAQTISRVTSGTATAIGTAIGAIGGPIGMMIGSTIGQIGGDFLGKIFARWKDSDRDARNQRVETAEKNLTALGNISNGISTLSKYAQKQSQTYEEFQEMLSEVKDLKQTFVDNNEVSSKIFDLIKETLGDKMPENISNIYQLLDYYTTADTTTRQEIANLTQALLAKETATETIAAAENKRHEAGKKLDTTLFYDLTEEEKSLIDKLGGNRWASPSNFKQFWRKYVSGSSKTLFTSIGTNSDQEKLEFWKNLLKALEEEGKNETELYAEIKKIITDYETSQAAVIAASNEANQAIAESALYSAKSGEDFLTEMNEAQLKRLGKDAIFDILSKQIEESGGLYGYAINSEEGRAIIEKVIKSNEKLYGLWTGQSYTLSEALKLQDVEVLQQFATALGVTIDSLDELENRFGTVKLGDILGGLSTTREQIDNLTKLFTSLSSSTGLTAENLETIINTYPELIPYLSDEGELTSQIIKRIGAYQDIYTRGFFSDMMSQTGLFEQFKEALSEDTLNALIDSRLGGAKKMNDILQLLTATPEEAKALGFTAEQLEEILKVYDELYSFDIDNIFGREILDTSSKYLTKMLDKQIQNLNEQKQALQDINKQREYENKLVEARLKLEDAQKQKKRVWRAGVGWVYEADQSAVKEAQDNLEQIKQQKSIDELQRQIDELTAEKETLGGIADKQELEQLENSFKEWLEAVNLQNASQLGVIDAITQYYNNLKISVGGKTGLDMSKMSKEEAYAAVFGAEGSAWSTLMNKKSIMEGITDRSSEAYAEAEKDYNTALEKYKEAASSFRETYDTQRLMGSEEQKEYLEEDKTSYKKEVSAGEINGKKYKVVPGETIPESDSFMPGKGTLYWGPSIEEKTDKNGRTVTEKIVDKGYGTWTAWIEAQPAGTVVRQQKNKSKYGIILKDAANGIGIYPLEAAAIGSLGLSGGLSMVNEMGTEAIVTPSGTITSLPSSTGVVPADITKNLWALGEVAPSLVRMIMADPDLTTYIGGKNSATDESFNVGTINMTVNADDSFDVDAFVDQIKTKAALSRRSKR